MCVCAYVWEGAAKGITSYFKRMEIRLILI